MHLLTIRDLAGDCGAGANGVVISKNRLLNGRLGRASALAMCQSGGWRPRLAGELRFHSSYDVSRQSQDGSFWKAGLQDDLIREKTVEAMHRQTGGSFADGFIERRCCLRA